MRYTDALKHFGGEVALAKALGCTRQAVRLWEASNLVPKGRAYELQVLTGGKLQVNRALYKQKAAA